MVIKDGRKLVKRAKGHAKYDHVAQMTYGDGSTNGKTVYQGCAVACLGMPATKRELKALVKAIFARAEARDYDDGFYTDEGDEFTQEGNEIGFELGRSGHIRRMGEEFGISPGLAALGECLFESAPTHGAAINMIVEFAQAVAKAEGRDITDADVKEAFETATGDTLLDEHVHWNGLKYHAERHEISEALLEWVATGKLPVTA